jgi:hypothetical protein
MRELYNFAEEVLKSKQKSRQVARIEKLKDRISKKYPLKQAAKLLIERPDSQASSESVSSILDEKT